jgi:hypothetical protein
MDSKKPEVKIELNPSGEPVIEVNGVPLIEEPPLLQENQSYSSEVQKVDIERAREVDEDITPEQRVERDAFVYERDLMSDFAADFLINRVRRMANRVALEEGSKCGLEAMGMAPQLVKEYLFPYFMELMDNMIDAFEEGYSEVYNKFLDDWLEDHPDHP